MTQREHVLVLDFGSQYTQLIARRIRELGVFSEICPFNIDPEKIRGMAPSAVILSGGPSSVYADDAPRSSKAIFDLGVPILGICYGLQIIAHQLGGAVDSSARREYGHADLIVDNGDDLLADIGPVTSVWMSHGDALRKLPDGFEPIAHSDNSPICAIRDPSRRIFGVQFHPEVVHTPAGKDILRNFLFKVSGLKGGWSPSSFVDMAKENIRRTVGRGRVLCALSGGVDSSVLAVLLHEAVGEQLVCIHINNGLMRKDESEQVVSVFREKFAIDLRYVDASDIFLGRLEGVTDPEKKRRIIGKTFIDVFKEETGKLEGRTEFLAQGTLYPDVIESVSFKGPSETIKTHHNVGGLPKDLGFTLVEPFRELFKDEVRTIGTLLRVPASLIGRHPFPGPGLAVRILGEITREKLDLLREADAIYVEELRNSAEYDKIWQAFAVLLPVQSVGVMGDGRTYELVCALRAVTSVDGMTADWARLPYDVLKRVSSRITNELRGINRVVYDVSSKPPATIEWE